VRHGAHGFPHEIAAVVKDAHLRIGGQGDRDLFELSACTGDDVLRVRAAQSQDQSLHGLPGATLRDGAIARRRAELHACHIGHRDRDAVVHAHHDFRQIGRRLNAPFGPHEQRFLALVDAAGASVAVVRSNRLLERHHIDTAGGHAHRIGNDLEATHVATEHVDVGDARYRSQGRPNDPLEQRATLGEALRPVDREHEHLAERRGHRRNAAVDALR
jgi:hypothetical protein